MDRFNVYNLELDPYIRYINLGLYNDTGPRGLGVTNFHPSPVNLQGSGQILDLKQFSPIYKYRSLQ